MRAAVVKYRSFYDRPEWHALRYRVLRKCGWRCMSCGRTAKDGVVIHCDHIEPISIYPELALVESNVQVLCHQCNYGKSNVFADNFRASAQVEQLDDARELRRIEQTLREEIDKAKDESRRDRLLDVFLKIQKEKRAGHLTKDALTVAVRGLIGAELGVQP